MLVRFLDGKRAQYIPDIHVFHTHDNVVVVVKEGTVEVDNKLGVASVHDLQLSYNALAYVAIRLDVNNLGVVLDLHSEKTCAAHPRTYLACHNGARCKMLDLANGTTVAMS